MNNTGITQEKFNKDLEKLRLILIEKQIIKSDESIGIKQFVKYHRFINLK